MKTLTYIFISIAATVLIYVLFAASLDTNIWAWDKPSQGLFLALVAITDLFLLRSYDKTSKQ